MRSLIRAGLCVTLAAAASAARAAAPSGSAVSANFSGSDAVETATARERGKGVRFEIADAAGKTIAKADAPSPGGKPEILLTAGPLGSAGALLEVSASADGRICRSVWRLRDGALTRLPIREAGGDLPDCEAAGLWRSRWEKSEDKPAVYVRERDRPVTQGTLSESRAFAFAGFALEPDAARSGARINGIAIPAWYGATLYRKSDLEGLYQRFGLDALRRGARLRFDTDREAGVFAVQLRDQTGEVSLPVTASSPVEGDDPGVELTAGTPPVRVRVSLARGGMIPWEAIVADSGGGRDGSYAAALHRTFEKIQIYPDAEHELAAEALPGAWAAAGGGRMAVEAIPGTADVRFGAAPVAVSLALAPEGSDLLLVPRDGSAPLWALRLTGPSTFLRLPVECDPARTETPACRIAGPGEAWRRAGSSMNVR